MRGEKTTDACRFRVDRLHLTRPLSPMPFVRVVSVSVARRRWAEVRLIECCGQLLVVFGLLWVVAGLSGCANRKAVQELTGATYRLRDIEFEGNKHVKDGAIEPYLNLQETTWFPLPKRRYLFDGFVPVDAERIEQLYVRRGYYDARVIDTRIDRNEKKERADVTFVVDEGPPTLITNVVFQWPKGPPEAPSNPPTTSDVESMCGLQLQTPLDIDELEAAKLSMQTALQRRGYAFASVGVQAHVERGRRTADVEFNLISGPWVRLGEVEFHGLETVPEAPVRVEIEAFLGKPYSPVRIDRIESSIYALNVFKTVVVQTAEEPRGDVLDLIVTVQESKPQTFRWGVGFGLEPNRWQQFAGIGYRHENLFGSLTRFDVQLRVGYAELPAIYDPSEHGPILRLEPMLRKKGFLEKQLIWTLAPSFELGIREGYQFYSPTNRMGVSRFFTRFVELGLSHNFRFVDFFSVKSDLRSEDTLLGLDFHDPYMLSFIEIDAKLHLTDRLLDPSNGMRLSLVYALAGGIFGGDYDYQKVVPTLQAYWMALPHRLQLAVRAEVGMIFPFGDEPGAPIDLRLYLGGANSIRGWGIRRLSPYIQRCETCDRTPVGGNTSVLGNFETRVRIWSELWAVAFVDAGDVQPGVVQFQPRDWNYSVGPGLRYDTIVGTLRLDVGVRVNNPPAFASERRWAIHLGLGDAF